jgi:hypothetical protein
MVGVAFDVASATALILWHSFLLFIVLGAMSLIIINCTSMMVRVPPINIKSEKIIGWYRQGLEPWKFSKEWKIEELRVGFLVFANFVGGRISHKEVTNQSKRLGCEIVYEATGTGLPREFKTAFEFWSPKIEGDIHSTPTSASVEEMLKGCKLDTHSPYLRIEIRNPWRKELHRPSALKK